MQLRSPFDVLPSSHDWRGSAASSPRPGHRSRAVALARQHSEELGLVLRLLAVMAFFGGMALLMLCLTG
ncbi:hypothetical protein OSH10_05590 [Kaistia defluvii]|uniref:hypothetical protein n=1 Tax=Kaistia defluvii TaxID=410841 RepID=UPI00225A417B|nr:hypothetical protein [Kaistia defluvii]MCX5517900.1 hypothetical protein [Kaistia defluvii]